MIEKPKKARKNHEKACLGYFEKVAAEEGLKAETRRNVPLDPFGLGDGRCFKSDLRTDLTNRIVIVETDYHVAKSLGNLAKYWPEARLRKPLPILLLHVFGRCSLTAPDTSGQLLWNLVWGEMKAELWYQDRQVGTPKPFASVKLFAQRFKYDRGSFEGMQEICDIYRQCLTAPLDEVCRNPKVFNWPGPSSEP